MFPYRSTCPNIEESPPTSIENENRSRFLIKNKLICCYSGTGREGLHSVHSAQTQVSFWLHGVAEQTLTWGQEKLFIFHFSHFPSSLFLISVLTCGRTVISRMALPRLSKIETGQGDLPSLSVPSHSPSANNCLKDKMADLHVAQQAKVEQGQ